MASQRCLTPHAGAWRVAQQEVRLQAETEAGG